MPALAPCVSSGWVLLLVIIYTPRICLQTQPVSGTGSDVVMINDEELVQMLKQQIEQLIHER